jgi:hypothetical protein
MHGADIAAIDVDAYRQFFSRTIGDFIDVADTRR